MGRCFHAYKRCVLGSNQISNLETLQDVERLNVKFSKTDSEIKTRRGANRLTGKKWKDQ